MGCRLLYSIANVVHPVGERAEVASVTLDQLRSQLCFDACLKTTKQLNRAHFISNLEMETFGE
jgi:hypothetical protein